MGDVPCGWPVVPLLSQCVHVVYGVSITIRWICTVSYRATIVCRLAFSPLRSVMVRNKAARIKAINYARLLIQFHGSGDFRHGEGQVQESPCLFR